MISIKNGELVTLTQKKRHIIVTVNKEKTVVYKTPESVDFIDNCTYLHALIYKAKTTPRQPMFICEDVQALSPLYHLRLPVGRRRKKIGFLPLNPLQKGSFGYIISVFVRKFGGVTDSPVKQTDRQACRSRSGCVKNEQKN